MNSGHTIQERVRNDSIGDKVAAALNVEKMRILS
jgi:hypothetical protein